MARKRNASWIRTRRSCGCWKPRPFNSGVFSGRMRPYRILFRERMHFPGRVSKKDRLANWLASTGLLRLGEYLPRRDCLIVMNHHRIGDGATEYDSGSFGASAEALDLQL